MDDAASADSDASPRRKPNWGCVTASIFGLAFICLVFRTLSPSDWVDVTVSPIPEGVEQIVLLAENSEGVEALDWYVSKLIPFTLPAHDDGYAIFGDEFNCSVQWKRARRYGVLAKSHDDRWLLWFLEPEDVKRPSLMRHVIGGGRAEIHLPGKARAGEPSRHLLEHLGVLEERGD